MLFYLILSFLFGFVSHSILNKKNIENDHIKTLNLILSNFVPYSQDFEDFILFYIFYDVKIGFYIDIGANDPNYFSVTKAFYQRGWSGINIEPLPHKIILLNKYRPRDINLQLGAGNIDGNATLILKGFCSSLFYNKISNNSRLINIKIKTMSDICKMHIPKSIDIEFCKIDVERSEKNVLLGFDFINYRPKVFCIESLMNRKTNIEEYREWEFILINNDYKFIYQFRRNRFYYDTRISGLKDKFYDIDKYVEIYKHKFFYK